MLGEDSSLDKLGGMENNHSKEKTENMNQSKNKKDNKKLFYIYLQI